MSIQELETITKAIQINLRELDTLPPMAPERPVVFLELERDILDLRAAWQLYYEGKI